MQLTVETFKRALPKQLRGNINEKIMDSINKSFADPEMREIYRDNILSYTSVMKDGRFKIHQYLDAVKYVGFKLMGNSNIEAYTKTFPDRYAKYLATGVCQKDIASYVTSYNKNKLVNLIYEQTLIPTHILNADVYQEAINVQARLMADPDVSAKVRSDAANSLLTHLKKPETQKVELDIGLKEDKTLVELHNTMAQLAKQQQEMIKNNVISPLDAAHSVIVTEEGEVIE